MKEKIETIVRGLKAFFDEAGFKRAVVGLSGGVDSALTAKLAAMALGNGNVTALLMPSEVSSHNSLSDAIALATELGIAHHVVPIKDWMEARQKLPWTENEAAHMNLQARIRMLILYDFANSHDTLVLGTGNKTEEKLGYFTKYGDGGVDVFPIGSLYKTDVWEMAKELDLPKAIIEKAPSAELRPGHTDEAEIGMTYAEMDKILKKFEDGGMPESDNEKKLMKRIEANRHKSVMPPVI